MTSLRQIEANRRNARLSTGPVTEEGKCRSRQNALRHGLTAETVIDALEDADDYASFQMAVTRDFDATSAVQRELVLRLASLLWRLRRVTTIESGLFKMQAKQLLSGQRRRPYVARKEIVHAIGREPLTNKPSEGIESEMANQSGCPSPSGEGRLVGLVRVLCNSPYGQQ